MSDILDRKAEHLDLVHALDAGERSPDPLRQLLVVRHGRAIVDTSNELRVTSAQ